MKSFFRICVLSGDRHGKGGQAGKFDRVYHNSQTGEWQIVECKGGTGEIGGRRRGVSANNPTETFNEQGTEAYIRSIIEDLNTGTLTSSQRDALTKINSGFGTGKVKSYILRQPFDDATSNLKEGRLSTIF